MNLYERIVRPEPRRCQESPPIRQCRPVITCFPHWESRNINHLILIQLCHARGRFVKGSSGNPRGGRGIGNRKRRVPDLAARPLTVQAPATDQMPAGQVYRPRHHLRARWSIARRMKENPDRTVAAAGCAQVEKNMGWLIKPNLAACCAVFRRLPPRQRRGMGGLRTPWLSFAPTVDNYFKQGLYAAGIAVVESSNGPLYMAVFCPGPDGAEWVLGNYLWKDFAKQTDTYVSDEDVGGRNNRPRGEVVLATGGRPIACNQNFLEQPCARGGGSIFLASLFRF
jgi:hypothetical protein